MRSKIAIVGSGITAGLATSFLAPFFDVSLFQSPKPFASGIPEIVPRRAFFDAISSLNEAETIIQTAPAIQWVLWQHDDRSQQVRLTSNEAYFVYDKGRLAAFLAESIPVAQCVKQEVANIADLVGFDRVFDCRGSKSVMNDPAYQSHTMHPARTACRYLVVSSLSGKDRDEMCFWSENTSGGVRRTFFMIPVGNDRVSLGCSCLPSDVISTAELLMAMMGKGINVTPESIIFSGCAEPEALAMTCSVGHVTPLGDAGYLSCPLSEYGMLKALSQIREVTGATTLSRHLLKRPKNDEIDPHLPQELFS
ncbi:hypothetical protein HGT70_03175 [Rosenbergiella collisarenosi]|uniref:hypothetical protein n=1 Tax=Rosenbergiella collisarenosi TaxID=1544695 RepID=UPI001BDB29A7|nr:hypothetical protein [Rosenbergiella collisarenosi]MBT0720287.1 hypothetical protein [Rosenbergiella collisarenosi]